MWYAGFHWILLYGKWRSQLEKNGIKLHKQNSLLTHIGIPSYLFIDQPIRDKLLAGMESGPTDE